MRPLLVGLKRAEECQTPTIQEQVAVMMTFYMALDGYGPAANVTGDGAIALICERFFGRVSM